ncbi:hypothetical protein C8034_v000120 [Colletotrichum sidae]|uniref:Uncharacterized protein n=1 Tax=Colletotrichum sidae TaxID=1347389 RepID=A0A4R8SM88_9PEZI|nr:hypothetical protein C8034_v000120 [Colletotrichum sidae]
MRGENAQQQLARSVVFARPSAATSVPSAAFADITAQHASMAVRKKPSVNTLLIQGEIITGREILDRLDKIKHLLQTISTAVQPPPPPPAHPEPSIQPSHDVFTEEPPQHSEISRTLCSTLRCESMLRWPIFNKRRLGGRRMHRILLEDSLVPLCRKLLQHVHSLNPVLEGRDLLAYAKRASEHGIGWDSPSYLVTRAEEERSWLCYLVDISLRRTIKDTVAVLYHQDERHWLGNKLVLARQYDEFEKKIPELSVSNPAAQPMNPPSTSKGASKAGANRPSAQHRHPRVIQLAQRAVDTCPAMVVRTAYQHRHGGSWFVARQAFSCAVMILAARLKDAHVTVPQNWRALRVMRR